MRMIERWFPCAEVSEASAGGWGSGKSEKALFTWFAARPLAQAKAAVLTSLLPWPEDEAEQARLQKLVRDAMMGRDAKHAELVAELAKAYPDGASLLDLFSGRAMIPLEAARLGVEAHGVDYSPVATLAGQLLADFPLRDWSGEPPLPFASEGTIDVSGSRLLDDVRAVLDEVGRRYAMAMADAYPLVRGRQPWGYLWAVTLPCEECGNRFPLTGSLVLRHPLLVKNDPGQSYRIEVDRAAGTFRTVIHEGPQSGQPTLIATMRGGKAVRGKSAICPFCSHVHAKATHARLMAEGHGRDALLVAADLDPAVGKSFREPTPRERTAADDATGWLAAESEFARGIAAVPDERIPAGNNHTVRPSFTALGPMATSATPGRPSALSASRGRSTNSDPSLSSTDAATSTPLPSRGTPLQCWSARSSTRLEEQRLYRTSDPQAIGSSRTTYSLMKPVLPSPMITLRRG